MKLDKNIKSLEFEFLNMKINLVEVIPKLINEKKVIVGLPKNKLPIGRKIEDFIGKIIDVKIREINEKENPKFKILKALSKKNMTFEELVKETKLSRENLRWYIQRSKNSLLKESYVEIKERETYLYKNAKGGCVRIVWGITNRGKRELPSIKQKVNLPRRKELVLVTSNEKKIILSSWWNSWLKPNVNDLEFDKIRKRFLFKIPENHIIGQYEKSKGILYSTILPKEIQVNEELFITSLGLLLGEMRKRQSDISFSNTESNLINYVLKFFKYFGLNRNNFFFNIMINTKNSKFDKNRLINYWSKQLGINKDKISNIFEYKDYGTNRTEFGRIDFLYYNIILKEIINNLISHFINKAQKDKNYAIYLLRGLLASEGYVSASTKSGSLCIVGIGSESAENKKYIVGMLKNLGIKSSIRSNCVAITSKDNFNKIIKYDLLKVSKDKDKFAKLYSRFKYSKD